MSRRVWSQTLLSKIAISFHLPRPPSVNHLYRNSSKGRTLTEPHARWRKEAGLVIMALRAKLLTKRIEGRYALTLVFGRGKGDLGNYEKAVSDLLVEMNVVDDDALAEEIHLRWGDVEGCVVTVEAA